MSTSASAYNGLGSLIEVQGSVDKDNEKQRIEVTVTLPHAVAACEVFVSCPRFPFDITDYARALSSLHLYLQSNLQRIATRMMLDWIWCHHCVSMEIALLSSVSNAMFLSTG